MGALARGLAAMLLLGAGLAAGAAERTALGLRFALMAPDYVAEFEPEEREAIEDGAAALFADRLARHTAFLDFEPRDGQPRTLSVELDRGGSGAVGVLQETGFHIFLGRDRETAQTRTYWVFRSIEQSIEPLGGVETFLDEIARALDAGDYRGLVQEVLSQVPVSAGGRYLRQPITGWLLPHTHADLCMSEESLLVVENRVSVPDLGEVHVKGRARVMKRSLPGRPWYRVPIFSRVEAGADPLAESGEGEVAVEAVYVIEYFALDPCEQGFRPSEAGFGTSGGGGVAP